MIMPLIASEAGHVQARSPPLSPLSSDLKLTYLSSSLQFVKQAGVTVDPGAIIGILSLDDP